MRSSFWRASPVVLAMMGSGLGLSCVSDFDTTREVSSTKMTLGEEIYTALCDRVGASSLSEDITGASYRSICHKGSKGWTGTTVNTKVLPPATGSLEEPRRLAVAKIEAMAGRRDAIIEAFDAIFPDEKIADPLAPDDKSRQVRLHDALDTFLKRTTPLYDSSPYATKARPEPPLMPSMTRSLGAMMAAIADAAPRGVAGREAFSRISHRDGYRPLARSLGMIRALLAYPGLRRFTTVMLDRTGPGGPLEGKFQHLLRVVEQEMRALEPDPKEAPLVVDPALLQPSRSRHKLEFLSSLLLTQDSVFAAGSPPPRYLALRDLRGFAVPRGATPGKVGSVPAPFADKNGDGYADTDLLGRFLGADGEPLGLPSPFFTPAIAFGEGFDFDSDGRPTAGNQLVFDYVDTSRTLLHAVLNDLRPLTVSQGDGHSPLMKALEGSYALYGPKKASKASYKGDDGKVEFGYDAFDAAASPLVELTHATGQFLGAPESDDYIGSILALHEKHPEKTARALQLAMGIWERGKLPENAKAVLAETSTFWDDMAAWLAKTARVGNDMYTGKPGATHKGLLADVTLALAAPDAVKYLPLAFGPPMQNIDRIDYNPYDINGPPINKTKNFALAEGKKDFQVKVERALPDSGDNRSAFQRFAHIIAAANHVNTCNKQGATLQTPLSVCGFDLPKVVADFVVGLLTDPYDQCALLEIKDLGVFFVDSSLDFDHPRRARMVVKDKGLLDQLGTVNNLLKPFGKTCELTLNKLLKAGTGINGISTIPSSQGLMRLVFFGAQGATVPPSALDPLISGPNNDLNLFISNLLDPTGTSQCPQNGAGVNVCSKYEQTLRGVEPGTFFVAETPYLAKHPPSCMQVCASLPPSFSAEEKGLCEAECNGPSSGFFEGIRPLLQAFASYSYMPDPGETCPRDAQNRCLGEQLFLDLMAILDKHWPTSGSGMHHYEELLAWVFSPESDLFGVVSDLVPTLDTLDYTSLRVKKGQKRSPLEVTTSLVSFLFDPAVAASLGVTDRAGNKATTFNDGKPKPQVTPHDLFARALLGFDRRFDALGDAEKKARWKSARSAMVDQFLQAENKAWKNPAIARALPLVGRLLREQVNANCPTRESNKACSWARKDLTDKLAAVIEGPLFGAINDIQEALRADDEVRVELENLVSYLFASNADPDSFALTLTAFGDLLQVLHDDAEIAPILQLFAGSFAPGVVPDENGDLVATEAPGAASVNLKTMKVLLDDHAGLPADEAEAKMIDRYHVLDHVLPRLVTPLGPDRQTPLEVILDTISAVQREDSSDPGPFSAQDYLSASRGIKTFLVDEYRGLEQFYSIVRGRNGN